MNLILILLIFTFILILLRYIHLYYKTWRHIEKLPGPKTFPIFGNVFQVGFTLEDYLSSLLNWWKMYDCDKYRGWALNQPYVIVSSPKDVEVIKRYYGTFGTLNVSLTILSSTTLLDKGDIYEFLHPWLGDGLLTTTGTKWFKHRKMITPSFHFKILIDFLESMDHCGDIFIKKLQKYANNFEIFDVHNITSNYTLDVICESAFGTSITSEENLNSDVVSAVYKLCEIIPQRMFSGLKRFDFIYKLTSEYREQKKSLKILKEFTSEIIEKRRKLIGKQNNTNLNNADDLDGLNIKCKRAFLDNLLTAEIDNRPLTFDEIFDEVSTFMFEGHDTTKSAIEFSIYVLSRYRDIQDKAFEEQKQIFGNDLKRSATYKELQDMHYLELIIKETLRLFPSVPIIARYTREYFKLGDVLVPPNTTILLLLIAMGQNEKYFKDALKINPERYNISNREKSSPFDSVPFSAGPRNCIGQKFAMLEIKTILSKILRNYEIFPPYDYCCNETKHDHDVFDKRLEPPILQLAITLKSVNGTRLRLKSRKTV